MNDPTPWRDDPDAPRALMDMIAAAKEVRPTPDQKLALAGKLGIGIGSSIWALPVTKWLLGGVLTVGGGLALVPIMDHERVSDVSSISESAVESAEVEPERQTQPVVPETGAQPTTAHTPAVADKEPAEAVETKVSRTSSPAAAKPPIPNQGGSAQPSEAQLLAAARGMIGKNPSRALQLLDQHESLYPRGILGQEREVLRVRALKEAGQVSSAERQAEQFRKAHPDSAHTTNL